MRNILRLMVLLPIVLAAQEKADSYICIADSGVGFGYTEASDSWEPKFYDVSDRKWVVSPLVTEFDVLLAATLLDDATHMIKELGNNTPYFYCSISGEISVKCGYGFLGEFHINFVSGRYIRSYNGSYLASTITIEEVNGERRAVAGQDQGGDTVALEIGKCSKI